MSSDGSALDPGYLTPAPSTNTVAPGFRTDCYQLGAVVFTSVFMIIDLVAVILRFATFRRAERKISWEDWSALLALTFYLSFAAASIYMISVVDGRRMTHLTSSEQLIMGKVAYAAQPLSPISQTFARLSVALLFFRLFWKELMARRLSMGVLVASILVGMATTFVMFFACRPIERQWDHQVEGYCVDAIGFLAGSESPTALLNFFMVGLAVHKLRQIHVDGFDKIKLGLLGVMGIFAGIISFLKIALAIKYPTLGTTMILGFWDLVQLACTTTCCCLPICHNSLPRTGLLESIRNNMPGCPSANPSAHSMTSSSLPRSIHAPHEDKSHDAGSQTSRGSHNRFNRLWGGPSTGPRSAFDPGFDMEKAPQHAHPNDIYMGGEVPQHMRETMDQFRRTMGASPQHKHKGEP